jgi:hypothetical protein
MYMFADPGTSFLNLPDMYFAVVPHQGPNGNTVYVDVGDGQAYDENANAIPNLKYEIQKKLNTKATSQDLFENGEDYKVFEYIVGGRR